jgi:hypothetical protein
LAAADGSGAVGRGCLERCRNSHHAGGRAFRGGCAEASCFLLLASCNLQEVTRFGAGAQRGFLLFADCAGHSAGPDGCRGTYCFLLSAEWRTFFRAGHRGKSASGQAMAGRATPGIEIVLKPVDLDQLLAAIHRLLKQRRPAVLAGADGAGEAAILPVGTRLAALADRQTPNTRIGSLVPDPCGRLLLGGARRGMRSQRER